MARFAPLICKTRMVMKKSQVTKLASPYKGFLGFRDYLSDVALRGPHSVNSIDRHEIKENKSR